MRPRSLFTPAAAVLLMLASQPAHAQVQYEFKVPFDFVANGQEFKAGQYQFVENTSDSMFTLTPSRGKGAAAVLPVRMRLAEEPSVSAPEIVFDKVEGKFFVSALTVPGDDGYGFLDTRVRHTRESLKGSPRG